MFVKNFGQRKNRQSNGSTAACFIGDIGGFVGRHDPSICLAMQCNERKGTRKTRNFKSLTRG